MEVYSAMFINSECLSSLTLIVVGCLLVVVINVDLLAVGVSSFSFFIDANPS